MKKHSSVLLIKAITLCAAFAVMPVYAAKGEHLKHAIEACSGKAAGDACSFSTHHDKHVTGTCHKSKRGNEKMVCVPSALQQAVEACEGKTEGSACTFESHKGKSVEGVCHKGARGEGKLFCAHKKSEKHGGK